MTTNKERMLQLVLDDSKLKEFYEYEKSDYEDLYTALQSENLVVNTVAQIINSYSGETDEATLKKMYQIIFNYLKNNYIL